MDTIMPFSFSGFGLTFKENEVQHVGQVRRGIHGGNGGMHGMHGTVGIGGGKQPKMLFQKKIF